MVLLATPVTSHLGGITFGGFGAAALAAGSRGRANTVLVGASTASFVLPLLSTISFAAVSTFSAVTAAVAGVHSRASVGPLLPVSS